MEPHARAVECIVHYFMATKDRGIILDPNKKESFSVYVDADFSGKWFQKRPCMMLVLPNQGQ
eukprot:15059908-Ditylum_brightwellii.AAC.1